MAKAKNKYDALFTIGASDETAAGIKSATDSLTSPIDKITAKWATLDRAIGLSAGIYLAGKAFNLLEKAFQQFAVAVEQQQKRISFDNLARSVGSSSTKIISELKKASSETITYQKAVETAGRSILLGLDAKILPKLMEIAKASSKVTGQTVVAAYEDITLGVARQSKMILDNLGIIVDYDIHLAKLAGTLGKAKDNLSDAERRQAFFNATMEAGEKIVNKVGVSYETAKEKLDKYMTSLADSKEAIVAHMLGLNLVDRAIGAQKYPLLIEQYEQGKKALDELLPKYNKLKEAIEAVSSGKREPSRFLAEQFTEAERKVKALQAELDAISTRLGIKGATKETIIDEKWTEEDDKKFFERQEKLVDWAAKASQTEAEFWKKFDEDFAKAQDDRFKGVMDNLDANMAEIEAKLKAEEERVKNTFGYRLGASLGEGFSFGAKTTISNGLYDLITDEFNAKSAASNALKLGARILSDSFTEEFLKTLGLKFNPAKFFLNLFTNAGQAVGTGVISGGGSSSVGGGGGSSFTGYRGGVGTAARGNTNNTFNYYITDDPTLQKRINEGVRKSFRDNNLRQDVKGLS